MYISHDTLVAIFVIVLCVYYMSSLLWLLKAALYCATAAVLIIGSFWFMQWCHKDIVTAAVPVLLMFGSGMVYYGRTAQLPFSRS